MLEFFLIFKWTILAGALSAGAMAFIGAQTAARDKSMQTLCIGQGAMLGVLIGIGFSAGHASNSEIEAHSAPLIFSILISLLIGWFGGQLDRRDKASKNTYFIALFSVILAMNYLVSAVFPALESHMAQVFFGDLATMPEKDVWMTMGVSGGMVVLLASRWRAMTNQSFEMAIFGRGMMKPTTYITKNKLTEAASFIYICFSIQLMGFLFTIACLFLPTVILTLFRSTHVRLHLASASGVGVLGAILGFSLSLILGDVPTVPTIAIATVLVGTIWGWIISVKSVA